MADIAVLWGMIEILGFKCTMIGGYLMRIF